MIRVTLDEAQVFDMLSIAKTKWMLSHCPDRIDSARAHYLRLYKEMEDALGSAKMDEVLYSQEYRELNAANEATFRLVDLARSSAGGLAKETDDANVARFRAKSLLQTKFFGSKLSETKTLIN